MSFSLSFSFFLYLNYFSSSLDKSLLRKSSLIYSERIDEYNKSAH